MDMRDPMHVQRGRPLVPWPRHRLLLPASRGGARAHSTLVYPFYGFFVILCIGFYMRHNSAGEGSGIGHGYTHACRHARRTCV